DLHDRRIFDALLLQPRRQQFNRVAVAPPLRLLLLRAVVPAVDVPDVVAVEAVRVEYEKRRPVARARALDCARRRVEDGADVLPLDLLCRDPERLGAEEKITGGRLAIVRVLVVELVLA